MADKLTHYLQTVLVPGKEVCPLCKRAFVLMIELTHRATGHVSWRRCEECATKEPW